MSNFSIKKTNFFFSFKAEFFLFFSTILWGLTFPFSKILLKSFHPLEIIFFRFFIASIILFLFLKIKNNLKLNFINLYYGIILGIFGFFGYYFQTKGLLYTTPQRSAFFTQTYIFFIYFIEFLLKKSKIKKEQWFSMILIIAGTYLLFFNFDLHFELLYRETLYGDLLTILSALCFSIYLILIDKVKQGIFNIILIHFFVIAFISFLFTQISLRTINLEEVYLLFFLAIPATLITNLILFYFQPQIQSIQASLLYAMEPIFALLFSFLFLKTSFTLNEFIGSLIIIFGSIYGNIKPKN